MTTYRQRRLTVSSLTLWNLLPPTIWTGKCRFRPTLTHTDSVFCTLEDCGIVQSLWNTLPHSASVTDCGTNTLEDCGIVQSLWNTLPHSASVTDCGTNTNILTYLRSHSHTLLNRYYHWGGLESVIVMALVLKFVFVSYFPLWTYSGHVKCACCTYLRFSCCCKLQTFTCGIGLAASHKLQACRLASRKIPPDSLELITKSWKDQVSWCIVILLFLCRCWQLAAKGILYSGCSCIHPCVCVWTLKRCEHDILQTASGSFTRWLTTKVQLGTLPTLHITKHSTSSC